MEKQQLGDQYFKATYRGYTEAHLNGKRGAPSHNPTHCPHPITPLTSSPRVGILERWTPSYPSIKRVLGRGHYYTKGHGNAGPETFVFFTTNNPYTLYVENTISMKCARGHQINRYSESSSLPGLNYESLKKKNPFVHCKLINTIRCLICEHLKSFFFFKHHSALKATKIMLFNRDFTNRF